MSEKQTPDLSAEARAIVRAAARADGPSTEDRARIRNALMATIAGGAAATAAGAADASTSACASAASTGAATTATATTATGLAAKLTIALALVVGGGTGIYMAQSSSTERAESTEPTDPGVERAAPSAERAAPAPAPSEGEPPMTSPEMATTSASATPAATERPAATAVVSAEASGAAAAPHPIASERATKLATQSGAPASKRGSSDDVEELEQERTLLDLASAALRGGNPTRALALLDEAATLFPDGRLTQEHQASRILALCALGRKSDAAAAITRFRQRYPASAHLGRIERACD